MTSRWQPCGRCPALETFDETIRQVIEAVDNNAVALWPGVRDAIAAAVRSTAVARKVRGGGGLPWSEFRSILSGMAAIQGLRGATQEDIRVDLLRAAHIVAAAQEKDVNNAPRGRTSVCAEAISWPMAELMEGRDRPALQAGVDQAAIWSAFGAQRQPQPPAAQEHAHQAAEPRP